MNQVKNMTVLFRDEVNAILQSNFVDEQPVLDELIEYLCSNEALDHPVVPENGSAALDPEEEEQEMDTLTQVLDHIVNQKSIDFVSQLISQLIQKKVLSQTLEANPSTLRLIPRVVDYLVAPARDVLVIGLTDTQAVLSHVRLLRQLYQHVEADVGTDSGNRSHGRLVVVIEQKWQEYCAQAISASTVIEGDAPTDRHPENFFEKLMCYLLDDIQPHTRVSSGRMKWLWKVSVLDYHLYHVDNNSEECLLLDEKYHPHSLL